MYAKLLHFSKKGVRMEKKRMMITVAMNLFDKLEDFSKKKGMTKSVIVALALEEYLKKEQK